VLNLLNLDERTRQLMLEEIERDVAEGTFFVSPRLSNTGQQNYLILLREAVRSHDAGWLADELRTRGRLERTEPRARPRGGFTTARVPRTAADTFAEGEFNRFYVRALCRRALEDGIPELIVYRAKPVRQPRPESEWMVGTHIEPQRLLADLRAHQGMEPALGLPPGPNSGLSVRLP
jgi:hypothetical protein